MFLGFLFESQDTPEKFLNSCSESERDLFFDKFGVETEDDMLKMCKIGMALNKLGYFDR